MATPTASRPIRTTTTSSCRCLRVGIANRKPLTAALGCSRPSSGNAELIRKREPGFTLVDSGFRFLGGAANLPDGRLLIAHHLPFPVPLGPKFADENSPETNGR